MSEHDEHTSFIQTPQQLVTVVVLAFLVPIIGIVLLVKFVVGAPKADTNALKPEAVAARIQPVGRIDFGGDAAKDGAPAAAGAAGAPAAPADPKTVYATTCSACHAQSVAGSPKLGDKAAWAPRIKTGTDALVKSVIGGKGAMPPKGGNASLSDADVRATVEYMVSQSK